MKSYQLLFAILLLVVPFACSDNTIEVDDYRIPFTGTYECYKVPANIFNMDKVYLVEVEIDSSSTDQLIINDILVPVSEQGTYGPDMLQGDLHYELRLYDDSIYVSTYVPIVNGIVAPCTLKGAKIE